MAHIGRQVDFGDSNDDKVFYTGNTTIPTIAPAKGIDTAVLSNGVRYDWNGITWVSQPTVVLDGNERKVTRATATAGVAPTAIEIPTPINGDSATIRLSNGNVEHWNYTGGVWALIFTQNAIPTTTNTLTNPVNTITSTVNGVVATAPAVNTNLLSKPTTNTIQSTVNGVASASQSIIATNVTTVTNAGISTTVNGIVSNVAPIFATAIPIADNEVDTAIRTGIVGTSLLLARQDHNHPIRRQVAPTAPVPVIGGTGATIVATTNNGTVTDEESVEFKLTIQINQAIANSWTTISIPAIAGFQTPLVNVTGTYRPSGNMTGYPVAPVMGQEAAVYFNGTIYLNTPNRTQAISTYLFVTAKYIRS